MNPEEFTGTDNYFEDFVPGTVMRHARGKTVGEIDNVLITNLVLNTAQAHFNQHAMESTRFGERITFGGALTTRAFVCVSAQTLTLFSDCAPAAAWPPPAAACTCPLACCCSLVASSSASA